MAIKISRLKPKPLGKNRQQNYERREAYWDTIGQNIKVKG
jgi:hypothetical protein